MRYNSLSSKRGSAPLLHNVLKCVLAALMLVSAYGCGSTVIAGKGTELNMIMTAQ